MHKEIEIQLYNILSEGEITAKEKEQIIQNGIKLGLDKFEVEMYVENYQINTADTKKCPFCNANIAFISNVCKYCGQELTLKTNQISDEELISNINDNIKTIDNIKPPTIFDIIMKKAIFFFLISAIITGVLVLFNLPYNIMFNFVKIYFILGVGTFIFSKIRKNAISYFDQKLDNLMLVFEKNKNIFKLYYTNNSEIQELSNNFINKYTKVRKIRRQNNKNALIIIILFFLLLNTSVTIFPEKNGCFYLQKNNLKNIIIPLNPENISITGDYKDSLKIEDADINLIIIKPKKISRTQTFDVLGVPVQKFNQLQYNFYIEIKFKFEKYNPDLKYKYILNFVNMSESLGESFLFVAYRLAYPFDEDTKIIKIEFFNMSVSAKNTNIFIRKIKENPDILIETIRCD